MIDIILMYQCVLFDKKDVLFKVILVYMVEIIMGQNVQNTC